MLCVPLSCFYYQHAVLSFVMIFKQSMLCFPLSCFYYYPCCAFLCHAFIPIHAVLFLCHDFITILAVLPFAMLLLLSMLCFLFHFDSLYKLWRRRKGYWSSHSILGWSDLALFSIFENLQISVNRFLFLGVQFQKISNFGCALAPRRHGKVLIFYISQGS